MQVGGRATHRCESLSEAVPDRIVRNRGHNEHDKGNEYDSQGAKEDDPFSD